MGQNVCCALCARDFDYTNAMAMQNILDDDIEVLRTIRTKNMTLIWSFEVKINANNIFSLHSNFQILAFLIQKYDDRFIIVRQLIKSKSDS